ncbi:MAG TPA: sulfotransferase [Steroidobacteraceae bacterium]|nr:sulfotransferase [Steroidobacteraceae bacterium]
MNPMQLGHAARMAGRAAEALDHYRSAVELEPDSAEAQSVYGLMLLQLGRGAEAEEPLRKAVAIAPAHPALRMNLAQWFSQQGSLDEAVRVVEAVVADEPNRHWAWERLGELKARLRRYDEAAEHFGRAVHLQPKDPSLLFKLAQANFDSGRRKEAAQVLAAAATLAPGTPAIFRLNADLHEAAADWGALEREAVAWRNAVPEDPAPWRALAIAQLQSGYPRLAMQSHQRAFELGGRSAEWLATYGRVCLHALDHDAAEAAFAEAEKLDPKNAATLSGVAILRMWKGDLDGARTYCRRALDSNPRDAAALKTLADLEDNRLPAADFAALQAITESAESRLPDRITAWYSLGDCLDAEDRIDEAYAAYQRANALVGEQARAERLLYDRAQSKRNTAELISIFDSLPPAPATPADDGPVPIFIVGMPRSGTTLLESVIGAHSLVTAGGESSGIRTILPDFLAQVRTTSLERIPEQKWVEWRAVVRGLLPPVGEARFVTDKNPWNFDAIGIIRRLFPGARIVHVSRDPVETGFSIWRNEFAKLVRFTHDLVDIGHYYGGYARVMAHWERVAGDAFTTIQYEDFVTRFPEAARELVAYCGLEWEEGCGEFWKSGHAVSTISTMQVRKPPERPGMRAEAYAAHLGPLVETLKAVGVDLETGCYVGQ